MPRSGRCAVAAAGTQEFGFSWKPPITDSRTEVSTGESTTPATTTTTTTTARPTYVSTYVSTDPPTKLPIIELSVEPTVEPTVESIIEPFIEPSTEPSTEPSIDLPTDLPTEGSIEAYIEDLPTENSTESPSEIPKTAVQTTIYTMAYWPPPSSAGAPRFSGVDVTDFLEQWDFLCGDNGVRTADQFTRLQLYVDPEYRWDVALIDGYKEHDWDLFVASMREEYYDWDSTQQKYTEAHLIDVVYTFSQDFGSNSSPSPSSRQLKKYCRTYLDIVKHLDAEFITDHWKSRLFLRGLPKHVLRHLADQDLLRKNCPFQAIYKEALVVVRRLSELETLERERQAYKALITPVSTATSTVVPTAAPTAAPPY
ncbi:MAG: hypothetical protein M1834_005248 [Cirrosporium novae-zelandiae]|nr:MAG: hypothetical protein M1834_005248 [Cirrosporium novae-zelandiae]